MISSPPLPAAVRRHLDADPRPCAPRRLLVAVSGGADSVALLRALQALAPERGLELVVAHLDHGLRGPAAAGDAAFVAALADTLGLPARIGHADVAAEAAAHRLSLEDAARRARRRFLAAAAAETDSALIALGHTRDDQAETVLLNLLRGAGPRGLAAMPAHGPGLITRPLLRVTRGEARAYLEELGQAWREDATNADPAFTRNRIRHDLLPRLAADYNPGIVEALVAQAELFADIDAHLTAEAEAWLAAHAPAPRAADVPLRLPVAPLAAAARPLRAAIWRAAAQRLATGTLDWERAHFEALDRLVLAAEDGQAHLPGGVRARRTGAQLSLLPAGAESPAGAARASAGTPTLLPLTTGAEVPWGRGHIRVTRVPAGAASGLGAALRPPDGRRSALFAAEALSAAAPGGALQIRAPRPGDRMVPFGGSGRRPVPHLMAEAGVPAAARSGVPLVLGEMDEILWIPGVARSVRAPLGPGTSGAILLEWFGPLPADPNDD